MLAPGYHVGLRWRTQIPQELRDRLVHELESASVQLSEMEALVHDAHRVASCSHAWLAPTMVLRLPLFDLGRRFRVELTGMDATRIKLVDEDGQKVADITLE